MLQCLERLLRKPAFLFLATALSLNAATAPLLIHVYDSAGLSQTTIDYAEMEAARLLAPAGIGIEWLNLSPAGFRQCLDKRDGADLCLQIVRGGVEWLSADAFGATVWHGRETYATILYDRILRARRSGVFAYEMLGKVIAHEIGHLLLGPRDHSKTGIMRAVWSKSDFEVRHSSGWTFTPRDRAALSTARRRMVLVSCKGGSLQ